MNDDEIRFDLRAMRQAGSLRMPQQMNNGTPSTRNARASSQGRVDARTVKDDIAGTVPSQTGRMFIPTQCWNSKTPSG